MCERYLYLCRIGSTVNQLSDNVYEFNLFNVRYTLVFRSEGDVELTDDKGIRSEFSDPICFGEFIRGLYDGYRRFVSDNRYRKVL